MASLLKQQRPIHTKSSPLHQDQLHSAKMLPNSLDSCQNAISIPHLVDKAATRVVATNIFPPEFESHHVIAELASEHQVPFRESLPTPPNDSVPPCSNNF